MSDSSEKYAALRNLWDLYCSMRAQKGLDIANLWAQWAKEKRDSLRDFAAETCFDDLCRAGCKALPLAVAVALMQPLHSFEKKWREITGSARQREQTIRTIEKAVTSLGELLGTLADAVVADWRGSIDTDLLEKCRNEIIDPTKLLVPWPVSAVPHPATTINALRVYASALRMFDSIAEDAGIGSSDMFSKYLVSAYVYRATNSFHDANVSALIGVGLHIDSYDETAHRMWRHRNFERIDQHLSGLIEMLVGFGVVSDSQT